MSNPLSGVLNKARTSLGGPLSGFQGPQKMQMPNRTPGGIMPPGAGGGMPAFGGGMPAFGGGMPAFGGGMPGGMMPQGPVSAPGNTGIIPPHMQNMGGGMPAPQMKPPMADALSAFNATGALPPGMPRGPMGTMGGPVAGNRGRYLAMGLRKRRAGAGQRFGQVAAVPTDTMPTMPSSPPGAALA